jgi:hypothetical protein
VGRQDSLIISVTNHELDNGRREVTVNCKRCCLVGATGRRHCRRVTARRRSLLEKSEALGFLRRSGRFGGRRICPLCRRIRESGILLGLLLALALIATTGLVARIGRIAIICLVLGSAHIDILAVGVGVFGAGYADFG